jgi:hypothetical protein
MKETGPRLMVRNVFRGGDQAWATVELVAVAECKSGISFPRTHSTISVWLKLFR